MITNLWGGAMVAYTLLLVGEEILRLIAWAGIWKSASDDGTKKRDRIPNTVLLLLISCTALLAIENLSYSSAAEAACIAGGHSCVRVNGRYACADVLGDHSK
jgi:hypothetical protein